MDLVLSIDIDNNNEACVDTAAIKARRRYNHICLAIQQTACFLAACIFIAILLQSTLSKDGIGIHNIVAKIIFIFMTIMVFTVCSEVIYESYQDSDQHDHQYDIPCGQHLTIRTPWFIKWCIRQSKK